MQNLFSFTELQSRFAPFPKSLHIVFCVIATIVFLAIYFRTRKVSNLLWMVACDMLLVLQFYNDKITALVIGICEVVLFVSIFVLYLSDKKKEKEIDAKCDECLKDIENAVKSERSKIASDVKDDVITQAFDNNDTK